MKEMKLNQGAAQKMAKLQDIFDETNADMLSNEKVKGTFVKIGKFNVQLLPYIATEGIDLDGEIKTMKGKDKDGDGYTYKG